MPAMAERYTAITSVDDLSEVTIQVGSTTIKAPQTESAQQGFDEPRISSNGQLAGWLALESNCCTSYPVPLTLVIFERGKVIRRFHESLPIWQWSFARHDSAVAVRQHPTHGNSWMSYKLMSISDGKTLQSYSCPIKGSDVPDDYKPTPVPTWVWSVANECPARKAGG